MRTLAILPVKSFSQAKQRLSPGLEPPLRQQLAEVMLYDVLAALAASAIDGVIVVTAGEAAGEIGRRQGAQVIADAERGHNAAAELGVREALRQGADRALLVPGDCPALDPAEVDQLLDRPAGERSLIIVPDRHGTGTNALLIRPPDALAPSFGPGSCARHARLAREAGIAFDVAPVLSLALDIDTPDDLAAL
ncbi:MAG: 2-phospho-L-lactate guanylyltransferase [Solirubrobacterales bacterium]|nr:2-phospho-L-lactate guanylyltransferase [Solirubrobacterales bacterium]